MFPIKTKQISVKIKNIKTEIVLNSFTDYIFIIISQTNKFGTWVNIINFFLLYFL